MSKKLACLSAEKIIALVFLWTVLITVTFLEDNTLEVFLMIGQIIENVFTFGSDMKEKQVIINFSSYTSKIYASLFVIPKLPF